ncbi:MAG: chromosome segregation protein SMC [Acidimicrobiia bacterium]|nr:chromosome segregation protein SMC [Acidimicrobiia bacterium]
MFLKTLSLAGFKSFADRTRLDFEAGVNVVVGPNGTGKSNLLDALAWVLGTQATRALRTEKMEDVIFAGTATRPALGRAEVSVVFDNSDGFLPVGLNEVRMTRRLYRDGSSEYELNGVPCRLLDLHELLSDGGVGRSQHVLVGQGQIGTILNARPNEHRAVIDEAAGVTKHKNRRDRSVRRLEQTEIDVARLNDILDQQRSRLRPLKRQANAAARHGAVRDEIKALHLWIGGEKLRTLRNRKAAATVEHGTLDARVAKDGAELAALNVQLASLRSEASEVGNALERDTSAVARLETVAERFRRIGLVARERRFSLESRQQGAGERRRDLEIELSQLRQDIAAARTAEISATDMADRRETVLRQLEDEERSLAEQTQLPAEGVVANLRGDLRSLENAAERDAREAEALQRRRELVASRIVEEDDDAATLIRAIQEADAAIAVAQPQFTGAAAESAQARQRVEEAQEHQRTAEIGVAGAKARIEALQNALSGLGDEAVREQALAADGVLGTVVSRLDVPSDLAAAVDAALGDWSDALVVAEPGRLEEVVRTIKSNGSGGVGFVVPGGSDRDDAHRAATTWDVDLLADRLGSGADGDLAHLLLGDVVLVEGWTAAWRIVAAHPAVRAVTPEGDLITATGMRVAQPDGAGPAALEAAEVALEGTEVDAARAETLLTTSARDYEALLSKERTALEALEDLEAKLAGHTEALALNERARTAGRDELERIDARAAGIAAAVSARQERLTELRSRIEEFEGEERNRQEAWEALNRRRDEVSRRRDEARRLREEVAAELASTAERRRLLQNRMTVARQELAAIDDSPVDPVMIERLQRIEADSRRFLDVVKNHIATLRERQQTLRSEMNDADRRLTEANSRHAELEADQALAKERISALAIELAEIAVRDEAVAEALRRDADVDEETALAAPRPELEEGTEPQDRLVTLEAQLRRMGPINPLAAQEYEELAANVELLEGQLADLEESRAELRKVIKALDAEMASMFQQAFEEVSRFYEENFALVFPGGKGRLSLTDPDKPLETGVEIEAQPHGKKIGKLSLLSGGEKSLAALAFLFAVFRARPSPFYVLDEVEAALDDSNLRRFLRLVRTLRASAQVVIITHQQQTMEAADILYGVTMEPGESSQVIAKRIREPAV